MLCHKAPILSFTAAKPLLLRLKPSPSHLGLRSSSFSSSSNLSVKMSNQTIEHVVLFKVKPDTDPSKVATMVTRLNNLGSLDLVVHLSAGPIHRSRSFPSLDFTHALHSRYRSKDDLASYSAHPDHLGAVRESVLPICDDILAVDWVADGIDGGDAAAAPPPGSVLRVKLLKLREGLGEAEKGRVLDAVKGLKGVLGESVEQVSVGENFSPERAKGFSIASLAVFRGLEALEGLVGKGEALEAEKEKVRGFVESVVEVDYVLPQAQSASL